jgi:hypothetical protein
MKIYAVMDPLEDCDGPVALYATRELAQASINSLLERLLKEWRQEEQRAGQPIPRQGVKTRLADGSVAVVPQTYDHPGSFDEWCARHGHRWIDELEVIEK